MNATENFLKKLNTLVSDVICEDFDIEMGNDFRCDPKSNYILISVLTKDKADKYFANAINQTAHKTLVKDDIDVFLYSLLHEIGHCKTCNCISACRDIIEMKIVKPLINKDKNLQRACDAYYRTKSEHLANQWAVGFSKQYPADIKTLKTKITKFLMEYYKEIGA